MNVHPGKLTWQWKIHIFNRRYIFIHASFSIVMLVFQGVVRPLGVLKGLKW